MAIVEFLQSTFSYVGPFIILVGLLIFIHEFGHFFVAKMCGVHVEVFSLGFGKKIFSFDRKGTTYCVSLIPLGGYVKMLGSDPSVELSEEEVPLSFGHKPVGQRIAIVAAGPLMNLFFGAFIFSLVALLGEQQIAPILGDIDSKSSAYEFGFRSGDKILEINNQPFKTWETTANFIKENPNRELSFKVEREFSEKIEQLKATTRLAPNEDLFSSKKMVGQIKGLTITSKATTIASPTLASATLNLPVLSEIKTLNGKDVRYLRSLKKELLNHRNQTVEITYTDSLVEKASEQQARFIVPDSSNPFQALGFEEADLYLYKIKEKSPAFHAGFQPGDKILSVDNVPMTHWEQLVNKVKSYEGNHPFQFKVRRDGAEVSLEVRPELTNLVKSSGADDNRFTIGVIPALTLVSPPTTLIKYSAGPAFWRGVQQAIVWSERVIFSFVGMIRNEVSRKNLGGVITIGKYAGESYQVGLTPFLTLMAIISINLFLINLLPIPVLDGGHLIFLSVEAIRGAPPSQKKVQIAQQAGFVIILILMAMALFNDISNIVNPPF